MSGLCGWFTGPGGTAIDPQVIAPMTRRLARFDDAAVRVASTAFGGVGVAVARGDAADVYAGDGKLVAVWGSAALTGGGGADGSVPLGAAGIAEHHAREGPALFARLTGSFAIAILDAGRGEALLAVDRMGTRPLGYGMQGQALLFGSRFDALEALATPRPEIARQALFDYVYHHMVPAPDSIHAGFRRLQPGEFVALREGKVTTGRHWQMRFTEDEVRTVADLKDEFFRVLRDSVRRAASGGAVGAFLSGGTDSSTIAGLLGEVTGEAARTYSIGFDAAGYDEMAYARIASKRFGTRHHEYYVTPDDVVAAIPLIAAVHDQPFGNSSAVPAYYCAKMAREDGIATILGGDGGDELFGGNERYAKQHLYSLYSDLPSLLRGLIGPVAFALPAIGVAGKAQRYMRHAMQPMPARYENYNLLERLGAANVFDADFLATVDREAPRAALARRYAEAGAASLINRMLALDFKYTLADNDLPKVSGSCELAGIGARYPLLDDALVEFSARLAPRMKLNGTRLRWFFKEASRGFLPEAIIDKSKHGFGLPFGPWLNAHAGMRAIAMDSLSDLKRRRIVRPEFIDELTSERVRAHAGYYGSMVWVLMMLEQWFRQHHDAGARSAPPAAIHDAAPGAAAFQPLPA